MRSSNNEAAVKAAIVVLAASVGLKVSFTAIAEPVAEVETTSSKGGIVIGKMTTKMARKLVASGKETYESLRERAAGGKCNDCGKCWATNDANRGGPTTHTC